jgi:hypothetical protein
MIFSLCQYSVPAKPEKKLRETLKNSRILLSYHPIVHAQAVKTQEYAENVLRMFARFSAFSQLSLSFLSGREGILLSTSILFVLPRDKVAL